MVTKRLNYQQMQRLANEAGEVDGISQVMDTSRMTYRPGTFTIKDDMESAGCRAAEERGGDHSMCVSIASASDPRTLETAKLSAMNIARTLTRDAFDDYEEARHWPHP